MNQTWERRTILKAITGAGFTLTGHKVWAQASTGQGILAKLQAAKSVRVGIANQPPFSGLNPDGTLTGLAPTLAQAVMTKLGVPGMEASLATYGELIPGMQAGRWDFVAASLTVNKQRCEQVKFSDPIAFDGSTIVSLKGKLPNPPKLLADIVSQKLTVGAQAGGANSRAALAAGVQQTNLRQFPDDNAVIDGLVAGRIQVAFGANSSLKRAYSSRNMEFDVVFPVPDSPPPGSACAFRMEDTDLHEAFQKELRAMKLSGQYLEIARKFGFDTPPNLMERTDEEVCKRA
jgi:polar amino acid transport system substrate-binding protein